MGTAPSLNQISYSRRLLCIASWNQLLKFKHKIWMWRGGDINGWFMRLQLNYHTFHTIVKLKTAMWCQIYWGDSNTFNTFKTFGLRYNQAGLVVLVSWAGLSTAGIFTEKPLDMNRKQIQGSLQSKLFQLIFSFHVCNEVISAAVQCVILSLCLLVAATHWQLHFHLLKPAKRFFFL